MWKHIILNSLDHLRSWNTIYMYIHVTPNQKLKTNVQYKAYLQVTCVRVHMCMTNSTTQLPGKLTLDCWSFCFCCSSAFFLWSSWTFRSTSSSLELFDFFFWGACIETGLAGIAGLAATEEVGVWGGPLVVVGGAWEVAAIGLALIKSSCVKKLMQHNICTCTVYLSQWV